MVGSFLLAELVCSFVCQEMVVSACFVYEAWAKEFEFICVWVLVVLDGCEVQDRTYVTLLRGQDKGHRLAAPPHLNGGESWC